MTYQQIIKGVFHRRINRFIAEVCIQDVLHQVHVKNTGRLRELLKPGANVILECSNNPKRKTPYSLIMVQKEGRWVNIDSLAPNRVAFEAIRMGKVRELSPVKTLKREITYGNSRFDLYFETDVDQGFIEVKGVTLENDGIAKFPDAPTARGSKHIYELIKAKGDGYRCAIFFIVQMNRVKGFKPNWEMDKAFAQAVEEARKRGVEVWVYDSIVTDDSFELGKPLPYINDRSL